MSSFEVYLCLLRRLRLIKLAVTHAHGPSVGQIYIYISSIVFPIWFSEESTRGILCSVLCWVTRVPGENHACL